MTNRHSLFPTLLISALFFIASCNQKPEFEKSTFFPVDPFIGSGGHGHVFVGANVPFIKAGTGARGTIIPTAS